VVTPRLLVRGEPGPTRNHPPKSFVRRETGHQQPDRSPPAKTGSFPPETGAPVPGGGYPQELRKNSNDPPPKPEGQFWQATNGDFGDPRCPNPRAVPPGSGHSPGTGPRASATPPAEWPHGGGWRRGKQRRLRFLRDANPASREAKEAKQGSCGVPGGVGSGGRGRHEHLRLPMDIILITPRSDPRFRANHRFFTSLWAPGSGERGPAFRELEEGSDDRTGPSLSTTNPT
jgi:hypothetical protein